MSLTAGRTSLAVIQHDSPQLNCTSFHFNHFLSSIYSLYLFQFRSQWYVGSEDLEYFKAAVLDADTGDTSVVRKAHTSPPACPAERFLSLYFPKRAHSAGCTEAAASSTASSTGTSQQRRQQQGMQPAGSPAAKGTKSGSSRRKGPTKWIPLMDKEISSKIKYSASSRDVAQGTEYSSVTVVADASMHEMMEFYLDDEFRCTCKEMNETTVLNVVRPTCLRLGLCCQHGLWVLDITTQDSS